MGRVVADLFLRPVVRVEDLIKECKLDTAGPFGGADIVELVRFLQMQLEQRFCMKVGAEQGAIVGKG